MTDCVFYVLNRMIGTTANDFMSSFLPHSPKGCFLLWGYLRSMGCICSSALTLDMSDQHEGDKGQCFCLENFRRITAHRSPFPGLQKTCDTLGLSIKLLGQTIYWVYGQAGKKAKQTNKQRKQTSQKTKVSNKIILKTLRNLEIKNNNQRTCGVQGRKKRVKVN